MRRLFQGGRQVLRLSIACCLGTMEYAYRNGATQEDAFDEAFTMAQSAGAQGFDAGWLAERYCAAPGTMDAFRAGLPLSLLRAF